jgi:group I intron endonuclease
MLNEYDRDLKGLNDNVTMKFADAIYNRTAIYMFINKINKKFYIGKASCLQVRLKTYQNVHKLKDLHKSKIYRDMLKFGLNNFSFTILEYCSKADLSSREQLYINAFKPSYNIRKRVSKL